MIVRAFLLVAYEETFGLVAPLFIFHEEAEATDTPFGLSACFFTENNRRAWRVAELQEAGMGDYTGAISLAA